MHFISGIDLRNRLLCVLVLISCFSKSQTYTYFIYSEKKEQVGDLKITRTIKDTITRIDMVSQIKVKLIITTSVKCDLTTVYHNNELFSNSVVTYRNNSVSSVAKTVKVGSSYQFDKDGDKTNYLEKINYSESMLYFQEPSKLSYLYSEFDGVAKSVVEKETNLYHVKNPINGNVSEYFYQNNVLSAATIHFQMMILHLVKQ